MTQQERYITWFENAKKNEDLIDVKFQTGDIKLSSQEEFYREANHFNEQLDRKDIEPLYEVTF
jgi:hypothetical protein